MENIPEGLNYSEDAPFHLPLFQGWMNLLNMAKKSVDIVSSHWDLNHTHPSACQVRHILYKLDGFMCMLHSLLYPQEDQTSSVFQFHLPPELMDSYVLMHLGSCCIVTHVSFSLQATQFFSGQNHLSSFIFVYKRLSVQSC